MKRNKLLTGIILIFMLVACTGEKNSNTEGKEDFNYVLEQFADLRILRYKVPGFEELEIKQKELVYYLSQAALCGRDILWDQNGEYNLVIRKTFENIYKSYSGNRNTEDYKNFLIYLKRIWFSNGIYHHYSTDKILPGFTKDYFTELINNSDKAGFPNLPGKSVDQTIGVLIPVIFDKDISNKKVCQDTSKDMVENSSVNFYKGVSQKETEVYYETKKNPEDPKPISFGLNSRLVKENGVVGEKVWKSGELYGPAIDKIIFWLEKALTVSENPVQAALIGKLISYYKSGDLKTWDEYNIIWVKDTSRIDFVNGFIETYSDPMGLKATWESVVNFKDIEATKRTETIAANAQWFEDHSPVDSRFKKQQVKGISAKVITVAMLGGDCYPHTPIGINLPNADWIRKEFGSKSVTLENITYAVDQADLGTGFIEEFSYDSNEVDLVKKYGSISDNLHTDLHECLGHGSGQLMPGVSSDALKNYSSVLEETRADLFALYYIMDPKIVELGLLPSADAAKAQYITYITNGIMTQLKRIKPGDNIMQAHMRNRQLISKWCYEKGASENVIEKIVRNGKTYFKINDFEKLKNLIGQLLAEVQRIKSEGDYEAGKNLVEKYGVIVDRELHTELLERYGKLNLSPYMGFVNPEYEVVQENGKIKDIKVKYTENFEAQMLRYSENYSYLPLFN
jgi:dipeptidyl-peptidase-3